MVTATAPTTAPAQAAPVATAATVPADRAIQAVLVTRPALAATAAMAEPAFSRPPSRIPA
jgi:hypothetical protein